MPGRVRAWLKAKALDPLASLARAGASPRALARSAGIGFGVGLCPVPGAPLPLLAILAVAVRLACGADRLNVPATLIGNAVSLPFQVVLLVPFLRAGARLTGARLPRLSPAALRRALWKHPRSLADVIAGALIVWLAAAIVTAVAVAAALTPALSALAARTSPPPIPRRGGSDGSGSAAGGDDDVEAAGGEANERAPLRRAAAAS